jgi:ArsR family transcriptional regulator
VATHSPPVRLRGTVRRQELEIEDGRVSGLVDLLKAVADPTRLHMLAILSGSRSPVCVCDLTATFSLSQPTISHHMAKLRRAGLVSSTKIGIWAYYEVRPEAMPTVRSILDLG